MSLFEFDPNNLTPLAILVQEVAAITKSDFHANLNPRHSQLYYLNLDGYLYSVASERGDRVEVRAMNFRKNDFYWQPGGYPAGVSFESSIGATRFTFGADQPAAKIAKRLLDIHTDLVPRYEQGTKLLNQRLADEVKRKQNEVLFVPLTRGIPGKAYVRDLNVGAESVSMHLNALTIEQGVHILEYLKNGA